MSNRGWVAFRPPWLVASGWWLVVLPASPRVRPHFWVRSAVFMGCWARLCRIASISGSCRVGGDMEIGGLTPRGAQGTARMYNGGIHERASPIVDGCDSGRSEE